MYYDYLIVGQGLAGTVLTQTLLGKDISVLVVDSPRQGTPSKVAAGIFNPITGRRMNKTWQADLLFPYLHKFYTAFQQKLGVRFFYPLNLYFPFEGSERQNDWVASSADPIYKDYISGFRYPGLYTNALNSSHGGLEVTRSGYVDLPTLINTFREYLRVNGYLVEDEWSAEDLHIHTDHVHWKKYKAKRLIFCDGAPMPGEHPHPFFDWLDFRRVKGELLVVSFDDVRFEHIINRGCWILPQTNGLYKVGATYDNHNLSLAPSVQGREELKERLDALVSVPYTIMEHHYGIRPATYDRRPFIGIHPEHPMIGIFSGLGAKGVSLAPYFAFHLYEHLELGKPLMKEVDIRRCWKKKQSRL